jgi:hypothetical protein
MHQSDRAPVRKRQLEPAADTNAPVGAIDLAAAATLAYSSEDPAFPVEHILDGCFGANGTRWISARPDTVEQIVVEFDRPQSVSRLIYEVDEARHERTQEVLVEASTDGAQTYRSVVVQEYTFSPRGATHEREDLRLELRGVTHLRLTITPNKHGSGAATLSCLQLYP